MSETAFTHDVFLSHSSKDKAVVRDVAERLRNDGLKVWFDEWEIKPGDSIPSKIEEGLEHSRVLVLCMSANAFGSDWAQLESGTFRFRDPLNKERRFIPLRLDDTPIKGSLAQFLYINWLPADSKQEYGKLFNACQQNGNPLAATDDAKLCLGPSQSPQRTHDLRISIFPTRNRLIQLAHLRILNAGERPILIDSWFVEWQDKSGSNSVVCEQGTLPARLQDHERLELLVDISNHPVDELQSLGVFDAEQRPWYADAKDIRRFIHVAQLHQPPKVELQPEDRGEPSKVSIAASVFYVKEHNAVRLEQ